VIIKPLEQWDASDFRSVGCIHCINNGGYHGPVPLTTEEYEMHITTNHPVGTPAYPGPVDVEKYGLKLPNGKLTSDDIWSCTYCIISNRIENTNKTTGFPTLSAYEKHIINSHRNPANQKSLTFDPEPLDLEKFESEFIAEKQKQNKSKSKVTEMAEANESGNGVMFHGNGEVKKSKLAEMTEANESGKGVLFEGNEKGAT
jgi:hypothetical protein